ncbi:hypothetical protein PIB30_010714 [Stylosanthes scabra]|uniref:RING-type domain-containing protein n=1 Tax=Stylosanthes scabra TaxID=79078 RepID=A0ABU6X4P2_9FABA|nr:hypothetical protein [Stylosanthes scabra]
MSKFSLRIGDDNNNNNKNEDPKVMIITKARNDGIDLPLCEKCLDFKNSWEMFKNIDCAHKYCKVCMNDHVASNLRSNNIIVGCPDSSCKVKYQPEDFVSILPYQVFDRWKRVIKECNTPIIDRQMEKEKEQVIHDGDDVKGCTEKDPILIESDDDDFECIKIKKD